MFMNVVLIVMYFVFECRPRWAVVTDVLCSFQIETSCAVQIAHEMLQPLMRLTGAARRALLCGPPKGVSRGGCGGANGFSPGA